MTQEEIQLLLIDLCARLPYGVKCRAFVRGLELDKPNKDEDYVLKASMLNKLWIVNRKLKPYLRPMSSMTQEEKKELWELLKKPGMSTDVKRLDWLNANHFDYRGLIPKGLALEAKEGMYKIG